MLWYSIKGLSQNKVPHALLWLRGSLYLLMTTSPTTNIQHPIVNATTRITTIEMPLGIDTLFPEPPPWVELPSESKKVIFQVLSMECICNAFCASIDYYDSGLDNTSIMF